MHQRAELTRQRPGGTRLAAQTVSKPLWDNKFSPSNIPSRGFLIGRKRRMTSFARSDLPTDELAPRMRQLLGARVVGG
jgi:hypothetical protein